MYFHNTIYGIFYKGRLGIDKMLEINGFVNVDWVRHIDFRILIQGIKKMLKIESV